MRLLKISTILIPCILLMAFAAWAQESKVGFVNPQRILNESKLGQIAKEDLARFGKEKDRQVREARNKVESIQAQLENPDLAIEVDQELRKSLRRAVRAYEDLVEQSTHDFQAEERRLVQFVMQQADAILKKIAQQRGFTLILTEPESIGYVAPSMDITDSVIRALNKSL